MCNPNDFGDHRQSHNHNHQSHHHHHIAMKLHHIAHRTDTLNLHAKPISMLRYMLRSPVGSLESYVYCMLMVQQLTESRCQIIFRLYANILNKTTHHIYRTIMHVSKLTKFAQIRNQIESVSVSFVVQKMRCEQVLCV